MIQDQPSRFIQIAVQPQDGDRLHLRLRNCIPEPTHHKLRPLVQQIEAFEVCFHLRHAHPKKFVESPETVRCILRIIFHVRLGQSFEGIEQPNSAVFVPRYCQNRAHENSTAAAPDAGFDEVSGNPFL